METDYSKTIFSQGIVVYNTNNNAYGVVIDGAQGSENDRSSFIIEFSNRDGFILHTPPNRALVPTGKICALKNLAKHMKHYVVIDD